MTVAKLSDVNSTLSFFCSLVFMVSFDIYKAWYSLIICSIILKSLFDKFLFLIFALYFSGDGTSFWNAKIREFQQKALCKGLIINKLTLKSLNAHHNAGRWKFLKINITLTFNKQ